MQDMPYERKSIITTDEKPAATHRHRHRLLDGCPWTATYLHRPIAGWSGDQSHLRPRRFSLCHRHHLIAIFPPLSGARIGGHLARFMRPVGL